MDVKWVISEEERTRHDALFYSQKPQDRYLSGEQARSLFIRSKLPLPELSKIWKLADVTRNNKLDISEFAVAMHLIQSRLKGTDIPLKLPETLALTHVPHVNIPVVSEEEKAAYERAFMWKNNENTGYIDAETACSILTGSGLPEDVLARIWNLADIDRDGKLSLEEFFIAIHLARFCKQGNSLEGSVNSRSILSQQLTEECYEGRKLRLAEVQTEKRKLLSLKEKLCHEIAGDLEEETMAHKIQEELDQVERQVYILEKEENELRRTLQQLKDKSKRESFKPFDRSFLLKRQPSGKDIFRGASKKHRAPLTDKVDEEIQKLWRENGDLSDFGASISEEPSIPTLHTANIRQDQFGRTVIELSENHETYCSNSSNASSGSTSPASNGVSNDLDADRSHSVYSNNSEDKLNENQNRDETSELTRKEDQVQESSKEVEKKALDRDDKDNKGHLSMNGLSSSDPQPTINGDLHSESKQQLKLESKSIGDSTSSDKKTMNENRTDDEKTGSLQMPAKNGSHTTTSEREAESYNAGEVTTKPSLEGSRIPLEETVHVATAPTAQSSAETRMEGLLLNLGEDEGSLRNEARITDDAKLNNTGETSPRSLTQEELIPYVMEEKKRKDEERAKQRELDDEMRRKAREELQKQEEQDKRIAEQRRAVFVEERRRLEHQVSLAQEGQELKKAPLSRTEAGRVIEQELEEQRIREELTRIEIEKIKEKERAEMEKQKFKHAKKEEHPAAFHNKDLIQKPIFDEKKDFLDGGDVQGVRISSKRGSVIDLSEDGGGGSDEVKKRPVENRPAQKPMYTQPQLQRQPQSQAQPQPQPQPVIRRTKDSTKTSASKKAENRKSFIELEIERQKEREEEARREAEIVRRIQAKKRVDDNKGVEMRSDEINAKEHRPRETSETNELGGKPPPVKKQTEVETVVQQTNSAVVESTPVDEIDAKQRIGAADSSESKLKKRDDEEARRKREEEKELFKQMQEEERKRREAHKADLERIRKEVDRKEAEELLRLKLLKEEEKKKQREHERRLAEERERDSAVKQEEHKQQAASRKTAFAAHKLILEQRVLKALEESKQEQTLPRRRASSFEHPTETFCQEEPAPKADANEEYPSAGVKLRKANFEKAGARKDSKEELRKKRYSLNIDHTRRLIPSTEDALKNKQPGSVGKKDRAPFYADDVFGKGAQAQLEREEELLRRVGGKVHSNEDKSIAKAKSVGDLSLKKGQNNVLRRVSFNGDETDTVDGIPTFSDSKIQKELEEQRMREEVVKKEITEREKKHRLEEEKKKAAEVAAGKKETSLNEIKRNPLPNKIQVKKPPSNRDSLTHSMAAQWETKLQSQEGNEEKDKKERKKSRIEIEKEEERRREAELQKERERVMLEIKQKEEASKSEKQRKIEEEIERKRKVQEEKEKRQQRTSAMKSLFEKMGAKK